MQTARGRAFLHVQEDGAMRYKLAMTLMALSLVLRGSADMPMLRWLDDDKARGNLTNVAMKILREDKSLSYAAPTNSLFPANATTDNILVHGDNLEALKALLPFYAGKVKCIYIDPPYNTGSAFEHYDDNLEHSQWLNLMYPRLKMLKEFLSEDGSIWISIDDDEGHYLKVICDEIFGRQNFVATVIWEKKYTVANDARWLSDNHDFILVYAKKKEFWKPGLLPRTEEMNAAYKNPDGHPKGPWKSTPLHAKSGSAASGQFYYTFKNGVVFTPPKGTYSRYSAETLKQMDEGDEIWFGKNGNSIPSRKTFLCDLHKTGTTAKTIWRFDEVGHNHEAREEVKGIVPDDIFATPKPERLIQRILTIATNPGDLVMDSFLGSGTTAAVAQKMGRRWIGIEMGEHAKTHCAVRMKKVVDGEQGGISAAVAWKGGGGFRFYELGEAILQKDGTLTEDIPFETMAAHVWFTETKRPYDRPKKKTTVLGVADDGVAYALLYNGILGDRSVGGGNVLTKKTLKVIEDDLRSVTKAAGIDKVEKTVVYAEACRLSEDTLAAANVVFRQTPYDLVVRK